MRFSREAAATAVMEPLASPPSSLQALVPAVAAMRRTTTGRRREVRRVIERLLYALGGSDQRLVVAQIPSLGSPAALAGSSMDSGSSTAIASVLSRRRKSMPGFRNVVASGFGPIFDSGP